MENNRKLLTYTRSEKNIYLISLAGQNIIYNIIGAALAYYLQFVIFIPAMIVSTIMTIARIWDAINDFFMGTLVDMTRSKWGKCRPYLIFVPVPILIITVLCFTNFGFYDKFGSKGLNALIVGWAAFTYILYGMVYTVGDIPLWGVTALMTEDAKDRNKLLSYARIAGGIGGGVTLLTIQPIALALSQKIGERLGDPAQGERWGFFFAALFFALIGTAMFQLCGFKVRERIPFSEKKYTLKENVKIIFGNKPFKQILLSGILGSPKMLIALAVTPLITYYFASKDPTQAFLYTALLGGGFFIGNFAFMALVPALLKKYTKKNLYNFSNIVSAVPFLMIFVLYIANPRGALASSPKLLAISFILFIVCGGSQGIYTVLQSQMIADCVDYEEHKNGIRPDGVFFAGQTFLAKLTTGIATIISGIGYTIVRFSDSNIQELNDYIANLGPDDPLPREMAKYEKFMMILFFLISIPPAIGCLLAIIPTWKYALDDDVHREILRELNEKRHKDETVTGETIKDEN
jgi:sugar (glycoside-pentoside-hexuronide) transporter